MLGTNSNLKIGLMESTFILLGTKNQRSSLELIWHSSRYTRTINNNKKHPDHPGNPEIPPKPQTPETHSGTRATYNASHNNDVVVSIPSWHSLKTPFDTPLTPLWDLLLYPDPPHPQADKQRQKLWWSRSLPRMIWKPLIVYMAAYYAIFFIIEWGFFGAILWWW